MTRSASPPNPPAPLARRYRPRSAPLLRVVLDWLAQHGPATAREVAEALHEDGANVRAALRVAWAGREVECVGKRPPEGQGKPSRLWVAAKRVASSATASSQHLEAE